MNEKTRIFDITKILIGTKKKAPTKEEHFNKRLEKIKKDKTKQESKDEPSKKSTNNCQ